MRGARSVVVRHDDDDDNDNNDNNNNNNNNNNNRDQQVRARQVGKCRRQERAARVCGGRAGALHVCLRIWCVVAVRAQRSGAL